ncbi:hypothetical protein Q5691_15350 [Microcoleus sp. w1-18aA5]
MPDSTGRSDDSEATGRSDCWHWQAGKMHHLEGVVVFLGSGTF